MRVNAELDRIKARHGYALLFDAHSIRGEVPRLFEGVLPEFNIGTDDGRSADPRLTERLGARLRGEQRLAGARMDDRLPEGIERVALQHVHADAELDVLRRVHVEVRRTLQGGPELDGVYLTWSALAAAPRR